MRTSRRRVTVGVAGAAAALLLLTTVAGCQGDAATSASDVAAPAEDAGSAAEPADTLRSGGAAAASRVGDTSVRERAVISSASITLVTPDVAETRTDVRSLLDRVQGLVAEEETRADDAGRLSRARLVLRVPSESFDTALFELAELGDVTDESRSSEDVTTKVIDTRSRVRAQQRSIRRIETLLDRAETLGQVVRIESELSRRQADLDSLLAQQAWLSEQSSLATIALTLRAQDVLAEAEEDEKPAFIAGLQDGWGGLMSFLGGTATVTGAALPGSAWRC